MGRSYGENRKPAKMDKVYRKYLEASKNPEQLMNELGIDAADANSLGVSVVRKETDLNNEEKQFLLAVERGDIPKTRHFLEEAQIYFNININCVDPLGRTALLIAIENENIEMIEILLNNNVEMGDALLHAINEENVEAVEMLLAHQSTKKKDLSSAKMKTVIKKMAPKKSDDKESTDSESNDGFLGGVPSSSFTPDITPIILAAHRDNYEIIKILLDRGDSIPKPHDIRCSCNECKGKSADDSLNHSRSRINAYRALSSPSLISLSSQDPILTAFELSWELKRLSRLENEFKGDYEKLANQSQDFAVDLLDQTRGSSELETVLNYDPDGPVGDVSEKMNLSRLKLAIKYKQKRFVAHPNCQQLLSSMWYDGLPGFRRRPFVFKWILTVTVSLMYPILSLLYLVVPKSRVGQFMRRPFIKFICHSASYFTFLFLLILASQRIESVFDILNLITGSHRDSSLRKAEIRGAPPTSIEWMIIAYVAGLIWSEVKQLWDEGAKAYIQDLWNILDFITNSLYIATFTLKLVAYLRIEDEKSKTLDWTDIPRDQWASFDPNLISEGLFAAANIFSSLKLIYIFTVNPHLGPLQISLGRMVSDIVQFLIVAFLVLFSYGCGVNQLYWYYAEQRTRDCNTCLEEVKNDTERTAKDCECDASLSNLFEILQTLYFAIYGLVDIKHFEIKQPHEFTQFVGKTMFGTYSAIMIIVLINMLIAMLSNSYQIISNDADTEWKYARSKLWMSYFEEGGTVPPPLNVLPTPKSVYYVLIWMKDKLCHCSKTHKRSKWQSIRKLVKKVNEREARYQITMRDLVKRYIMARQKHGQNEGVTEDDLNEIKQDISSFRYELLEILRENGMKLPNQSIKSNANSKISGKLRRKGSRMSMERQMKEKIQMEPVKEDSNEMPSFLQRVRQLGRSKDSQGSNLSAMSKESVESSEDQLDSSKADINSPVSNDEGLGESFEQNSESSEGSLDKRVGSDFSEQLNGVKNNMYDTVPEEKVNEKATQETESRRSSTKRQSSDELPLDPNKLPQDEGMENTNNHNSATDEENANKKGLAKSVSFYGDDKIGEIEAEPVSETFVYKDDKNEKSKGSGWFNKRRERKK